MTEKVGSYALLNFCVFSIFVSLEMKKFDSTISANITTHYAAMKANMVNVIETTRLYYI